jgi:hypothetical protein
MEFKVIFTTDPDKYLVGQIFNFYELIKMDLIRTEIVDGKTKIIFGEENNPLLVIEETNINSDNY